MKETRLSEENQRKTLEKGGAPGSGAKDQSRSYSREIRGDLEDEKGRQALELAAGRDYDPVLKEEVEKIGKMSIEELREKVVGLLKERAMIIHAWEEKFEEMVHANDDLKRRLEQKAKEYKEQIENIKNEVKRSHFIPHLLPCGLCVFLSWDLMKDRPETG